MIAGAGNVVIFNRICSRRARKVTSAAAGCGLRFHGRMGLGSWSDRSRIGKTLRSFSANFSKIWVCNFAWQAQYLVRCEGDACCSAHCK